MIVISTDNTDEIKCPYCGEDFIDSWEYSNGEEDLGLIECTNDKCRRSFYAYRNVSITYSTEKAKYGTCKHCDQNGVVIEDYTSSIGSYKDLCVKCGEKERHRLYRDYLKTI